MNVHPCMYMYMLVSCNVFPLFHRNAMVDHAFLIRNNTIS